MPKYSLQINIDPTYVKQIVQAGQQVVIMKQVAGNGTPLTWLTFSPYQSNTVTWQDQYAVFASQSQIQSGATITQLATRAASPRTAYGFDNNIFTVAPSRTNPLTSGQYEVINQSNSTLTFGLAQAATLNGSDVGTSALFAGSLLPNQWLDMTPNEIVSVFLYNNTQNAMCLGTVMGPSLEVSFGGATTSQTISFDYNLGGFNLG